MRNQNISSSLDSTSSSQSIQFPASAPPVEQRILQEHLLCPILRERMTNPVIAADGYTYERRAITAWISTRGGRAISPMTGERLAHLDLQDNRLVKQLIVAYKDTKTERQQRALTEHDIVVAMRLREDELSNVLAKQGKQLEVIAQERNAIVQKLEPQAVEIERLRQENEALRRLQNLPEDKRFVELNTEVVEIEKALGANKKNHAASVIQEAYHRRRLRQSRQQRWLHVEKQALLEQQAAMKEKFTREEGVFEEKIASLAAKKLWMEVAKQGQVAEMAKQKHIEALEKAQEPLRQLEKDKVEKHQRMVHQTTRFNLASQTKNRYWDAILNTSQAQNNACLKLSAYLTEREEAMKRRNVPRGFLFRSAPMIGGSSSASTSSAASQPQTALKTNQGLSAEKMQLQNELAQACYDCDIDKVKVLIEQKGADPAIPDKDGRQPMAAAIWGLSFKVMDYLEEKVAYYPQDWLDIGKYLQCDKNIILPQDKVILTYGDFLAHYERQLAPWIYDIDKFMSKVGELGGQLGKNFVISCKPRGVMVSMKIVDADGTRLHETIVSAPLLEGAYQRNCLTEMCEAMANRLRGKGLVISENNQLVLPTTESPKP
jgi:hypothetical protein